MPAARGPGARSTAAAAAGTDHQRAMALALVGRSLERRTALEQRVKKLDPVDRASARLNVDKELKRDPDAVSPRSVRAVLKRQLISKSKQHTLREIGGVIVRGVTATPRSYGNDRDDWERDRKADRPGLKPPGRCAPGGNHHAPPPDRTGVAARPGNEDRSRERPAGRSEQVAPAR